MKHVLLIAALFVSVSLSAQKETNVIKHADVVNIGPDTVKQDTTKKVIIPQQEKAYFLVLPESSWTLLIQTLRKSTEPSNKIEDMVTYMLTNLKELKIPEDKKPK